ncbi:MAG: alpha-E domain-containing protein [Myxococcota bacterium]
MLSRVAGSLYWMGRYLERAENVARLLLVTAEDTTDLEGLDEVRARAEWEDLARAVPSWDPPDLSLGAEQRTIACIESLLLDPESPVSVRSTLGAARENARGVREALTREVFENLNEAHQDLRRRRRFRDRVVALDAVRDSHRAILTTLGAIELTLSRDQGWTFMKLGEAIARTLRTLLVLRARLPGLRSAADADLPLYYARWRATLRSVASLENHRRTRGSVVDADAVVRFLLFEANAPRSVRCGLARVKRYVDTLPRPGGATSASRIAGRLLARIEYDDEAILEEPDLTPFCDEMVAGVRRLHDSVERQYFPS